MKWSPGFIKNAIFHYKQSTFYDRKSQFTINYNSDNYDWPLKRPILSKEMLKKDKMLVLGGSGFIGTNLLKN